MEPVKLTAIDAFVYGLPDELARAVDARDPKTLKDAVDIAVRAENRQRHRPSGSRDYYRPTYESRQDTYDDYRSRYRSPDRDRSYPPRYNSFSPTRREQSPERANFGSPIRDAGRTREFRNSSPIRTFRADSPARSSQHHCLGCRCAGRSPTRRESPEPRRNIEYRRPRTPPLEEPVPGPSRERLRSPSPDHRDNLNFDATRQTDATTSQTQQKRKKKVQFQKKRSL
ncbi:serine/arginine repetitive matrix protein 1-like [Osmia bicornis bicornis]|uniref:serine/arginine repetitive matrix protein 1-like n=1 Tax=Osmia bicornis bicornis TaxID=1437191 RepID=UPI001EAEDB77|nr:serine/arginine repetitive matrix protein 1-like [Osmia bicornis bicornis]